MELTVRGLTKQYKDKRAVDRVDLRLTEGINGLPGANGAGKTTLMRMLCGILKPTAGRISLDGVDVTSEDYRAVLGYLPQDFGYYPDFTGLDFLLYLAALILGAAIASKRRQETANTTRRLNPKLGLLGFAGFLGFLGFWTYGAFRDITPFIFFAFFGFFGFFYEGKLSNTLMDERYVENKLRAELTAHRVMRAIVFLTLILFGRGALLGSLEYTLIAVLIVLSLTVALDLFLSEYLLYRYDHSDQLDGGGEERLCRTSSAGSQNTASPRS